MGRSEFGAGHRSIAGNHAIATSDMTKHSFRKIRKHRSIPQFSCILFLGLFTCFFPALVHGDTNYYRHVVFDNSLTPDHYYYSWGQANGGSVIQQEECRLPVRTKTFFNPPHARPIRWQSHTRGGWGAEV